MLTFEQIKELIELVAERNLQGMEVERSGFRLKIDGKTPPPAPPAAPAGAAAAPASAPAASAPAAAPAEAPRGAEPAAEEDDEDGLPDDAYVQKSPIVGTFYRSPSPDADPFAKIGEHVKKGQVLGIVEAMKVFNDIEAEVSGKLLEVYPQNEEPVEFEEPLFAIQPD